MRRIFLLSVLSFLAHMSVNAQSPSLSGSVKDTTANAMVKNAVVAFLSPGDSILKAFTRTSAEGKFEVPSLKPGKYILMVMHPVFADLVDDVTIGPDTRVLTTVFLTPKSKLLQEVIVKSGAPIKIKGDTTIYTADSFKVSANANVEELLKKLPGIQVDRNGEIKAMGETVEKVLVDGEEFFGDDPGMAVKNLRADAVKEVQVFDKKSEQAEFTGIDDGKTQKTINLKLKEDKKRGYFGKISAAGGLLKNADPRFNNNLMFGSFKGKRKLSAFVLNGNTGQDGMNWQDMQKYGGSDDMNMEFDDESGGMYFWRGGTSADDEPNINTENGFITNVNAGLQYTNKWNDKQTLNFSPKFNSQDYSNITDNFTQTLLGDSILNENANTRTAVLRTNLKTSAIYDVKVDSMNSIKFTVKANAYHTESEETRLSETAGKFGNIKNSSDRLLSLNSDKLALTANIVYKHKFRKNRRTLSINTDWNLLNTDSRNTQQSANRTFETGIPELELINQQTNGEKQTQRVGIKVVYTEPLSKKWALEIGHELSYNFGNNNQTTYAYSNTSGKYDQLVDSLTNDFKQHIMLNKPSVKFSYNHKKLKFNLGSGFGITNFDLTDRTNNKEYIRNFVNFFPTANVNYSYKSNHSLRLSYSGSTSQPTINQLQPLRNNNNQFNQYIGNPDLKPSFANNFSVTHNGYDFKKDRWMFQSLNVTLTSNSITNNRVIDPGTGKTITQPINTNGNWNINFWSGVGFKLKKSNIRLNVSPNVNYFRFADVINNKKSFANTLNAGISVYASKSKDKKYDFTIGNDFNENYNKNAQTNSSSTFFTNTLHAYATVYHKKVWSLITEYHFNAREKTVGSTSNLNNHMLNAQLQRTFKNNEFTAFVSVKDILNQNIGIDRNFYSNTYTEERNLRLKRYFLVGFTWDFKNKNKTGTEKK
jgi:hypothetical protein